MTLKVRASRAPDRTMEVTRASIRLISTPVDNCCQLHRLLRNYPLNNPPYGVAPPLAGLAATLSLLRGRNSAVFAAAFGRCAPIFYLMLRASSK